MSSSAIDFLRRLTAEEFAHLDRAVGLLWWYGRDRPDQTRSARALAAQIEAAGYGKQNVSRLRRALKGDSRVVQTGDGFRVNVSSLAELDEKFSEYVGPRRPEPSDSVLPLELFFNTRDYIEQIVFQINAAYDHTLYDCCAVMCRRLIETLLIEVYELNGKADDIKDSNGNFFSYGKLRSTIESDDEFYLGRDARRGLQSAKRLGDLSAHNRRIIARQDDIERERNDLRVISEELLRLADLV